MKLKDIMTKEVEVVRPDASLQDAARKMRSLNVGAIPVCDGARLEGMLTDRDITIRATADGRDPRTTMVNEVMTSDIVFCYEDQDAKDAARMMGDHQIRRLPVLSRDKKLIGIVSLGDISVDLDKDKLTAKTLEDISKPSKPER